MSYLEIKHLRMIQMISRTNNLTKAAERLFVSQSALSQQLKSVEEKIGANLFFRNGKNMVLTKIGKKLLDSAHTILDEVEKTEREVAKEINGEKGELKIGVRCVYCFKWIPSAIKQFQEKYPNVDIEIAKSHYPEEELMSKTFDLTISSADINNNKITYTVLYEDDFLYVMSGDHPLSYKKYMDLKDFEGADMIELGDKKTSSFYNFFKERGIKLRRHMSIPYPETAVDIVEAGLGIAIMPNWFVAPYMSTKNLHTCKSVKKSIVQWRAHYLKEQAIPSYQNDFINIIISRSIVD